MHPQLQYALAKSSIAERHRQADARLSPRRATNATPQGCATQGAHRMTVRSFFTRPPHRSTDMTRRIIRTATIALAAAALAAPTALARPADMPRAVATATAAAQHKHDRRPHDTNVGVYTPGAIPAVSYPSGATAGGQYTPGATPAVSRPRPITPAPAVQVTDTGSGVRATTIGLGIAGSLIALAGVVGIWRRSRRLERARLTA
jgi:hypothetical protein